MKFKSLHRESVTGLPAAVRQNLSRLQRRLLPRELDRIILTLAATRPLRLHEIARLLQRSPVYLQNTAVKRLLQQGKLRFFHPEQPNHPRQAYVICKSSSVPPQEVDIGTEQPNLVRASSIRSAAREPPVASATEIAVDIGRND
ncbi:MAG: hypothetical protein HY360_08030 [Verrucomicrobia bacterium]|nr:hypothetical protein [Verrucomicrobiota bacterium]